ncbi:MAG: nitroreductase family protein [Deltaproteobacteria bacterium]|nr:nitroreductase family protein [Deltaproteobacteria bacterium]
MQMLEEIKTRRSIRRLTNEKVDDKTIELIIEMGTWAPSGLNNQPWKFVVIRDQKIRDEISTQTKYSRIIQGAPVCIAVFLDNSQSYDRVKDIQAVGACIQNMLLTIHDLGLGGVWLGEILKNRESVEKILKVPESCELMAVVALGHTEEKKGAGSRKSLDEVIIARK